MLIIRWQYFRLLTQCLVGGLRSVDRFQDVTPSIANVNKSITRHYQSCLPMMSMVGRFLNCPQPSSEAQCELTEMLPSY